MRLVVWYCSLRLVGMIWCCMHKPHVACARGVQWKGVLLLRGDGTLCRPFRCRLLHIAPLSWVLELIEILRVDVNYSFPEQTTNARV